MSRHPGLFIWLFKEWLSTRLKASIQHEYDRKIETFKAELKTEQGLAAQEHGRGRAGTWENPSIRQSLKSAPSCSPLPPLLPVILASDNVGRFLLGGAAHRPVRVVSGIPPRRTALPSLG
jgi:hypothetical protein